MRKKNVLIWGAGIFGEHIYHILEGHNGYNIVAFGDNNKELWGIEKCGKPVLGPVDLKNIRELDCVYIASVYVDEIKKQLKQILNIPVYISMDEMFFQRMAIDISGYCNAKCKWCVTGRKNRREKCGQKNYMTYELFVKLYNHLYQNGIIGKNTELMLYNWGEPFLNENYEQIVDFLAEQKQKFAVSTNASKVRLLKRKDAYKNCDIFIFSLPGFSQESYNRIHGFSFEQIKKNIEQITLNLKEKGFEGDGVVSYHVYRFNVGEIEEAKKFAKKLRLRFNPYYPYFNGNSMTQDYLENTLTKEMKKEAEEEMFLSHVNGILSKREVDYRCFLENILSVDCRGDLTLCCASDSDCKDYRWESIFNITSFEEMKLYRQKMLNSMTCKKCRELGIDFWMENNPVYEGKL